MPNQETINKYAEAVKLYADTDLTQKEICKRCHIKLSSFRAYLHRNCRTLLFKRYHLDGNKFNVENTKLHGKTGQSLKTQTKYKKAIKACKDKRNLAQTVTHIAHRFGLNGTALANQLRMHYPEIFIGREEERKRLGLSDRKQRGVRSRCTQQYAQAVEMLRTTDNLTIKEVAQKCNVSFSGLRQHIQFYHKDISKQRFEKREQYKIEKQLERNLHKKHTSHPRKQTDTKYATALHLYQTTSMTIHSIAEQAHVPFGGFCNYLRMWHRDLMKSRRNHISNSDNNVLQRTSNKKYLQIQKEQYAAAIERIRESGLSTTQVAAEFGINPTNFRNYLYEHMPELAANLGIEKNADGRKISQHCTEKYAQAILLYETSPLSLRQIAQKFNLVYNSLIGFIHRNHPEVIIKHKALKKKRI